jgi:hypothetical protein
MQWFLYDETARDRQGIAQGVPLDAIQEVRHLLQFVKPYISLDQVEDESVVIRPRSGRITT